MINRFLVVIVCMTMFGCATPLVAVKTTKASPLVCDETGTCMINIINPTCTTNPCSADIDRDPVTFKRGRPDIKVHWKLPNGFAFCADTGDGVFLKEPDSDNQFKDPGIDDAQGSTACKHRQYKWTAKNTISPLEYPYTIVFHNAAGTRRYIIDPVMINE